MRQAFELGGTCRQHRHLRRLSNPPHRSLGSEMTTQALNARSTLLFESLKQTHQLITRLSKFPSQPGASASNPDEGDARVELSAEIHQSLKEQEEDLELLRQEVEDQTNTSSWSSSARRRDSGKDSHRTDLAAQVTRLGEDLKMWALRSIVFLALILTNTGTVLVPNSAKLSFKLSATQKPQSAKNENSYSQVYKKETVLQPTVEERAKKNYHRRKYYSMLRAT